MAQWGDGMEKITVFDFLRYKRMRERNADYSRALARTNLAVRCWLGRVGDGYHDDSINHSSHRILAWMLTNHILQAFFGVPALMYCHFHAVGCTDMVYL